MAKAKKDSWGEVYKKTQAAYLAELKRETGQKKAVDEKGGKR